ncbi:sensor histidine kinase [Oceanobacter mangrovi]|uniref:sensor histidine kinase n=1 Tax=Oceanobacter mangrovi TaxID=2862510 RepID=UPI001C8DBF52|nr:PAS domain S-box protein [Oceanobacter mangrovi]
MAGQNNVQALKAASFDALLQTSDLGLAILDRDLRYVSINETLACFNGISAERHIGATVTDLLPDLAPIIIPMLHQVIQTGVANLNFKVTGQTPGIDGEEAEWLGSYIPVFPDNDASQPAEGVLVVAENLTLKRQLERAKAEASDLVRRVIDGLFAFVGVLDLDGVLLDVNKAPLASAGIDAGEVIGKKFWDTWWWNHDPAAQQLVRQSFELAVDGKSSRYEIESRANDDEMMIVDFMMAPLRDSHGNVTHVLPSAIDISDRVISERKLKYSEERFRRVFDSTADGLLLVGEDGSILLANQRAGDMFGYSREEILKIRVEDLIPTGLAPNHADLRAGYMADPKPRTMAALRELEAQRKDGTKVPVEIGLTPLTFSAGTRILATVMDVSIQKSIQQKLEQALDEKTSLLNEVHHRVKNNLQVVSSLLSLQTRQVPEEVRSYFIDSQDRIRAMALIHQLLYEQKHYDRIDVMVYTERLLELVRRSYLSSLRGIDVRLNGPSAGTFIPLDIAQPFGLFMNEVITNAVKHAFVGRDRGCIDIQIMLENEGLAVVVADDGNGLPAGFEPQSSPTLGFQLIQGLVEQMNAQIELQSDSGTCFVLHLQTPQSVEGATE